MLENIHPLFIDTSVGISETDWSVSLRDFSENYKQDFTHLVNTMA